MIHTILDIWSVLTGRMTQSDYCAVHCFETGVCCGTQQAIRVARSANAPRLKPTTAAGKSANTRRPQ